jgi:hypothetical protein
MTKNANLSERPKIKFTKRGAPAGVNAPRNILFINENLMVKWQNGEVTEEEIDATLAELGVAFASASLRFANLN